MDTVTTSTSAVATVLHLPVSLATAGALGLLLLVLSFRVIAVRRSAAVSIGHGDSDLLLSRIRAHANLTEYAPVVLVLVALLELAGTGRTALGVLAGLFVLARCAHAAGMSMPAPNPMRVAGTIGTFLILAILSIMALLRVL